MRPFQRGFFCGDLTLRYPYRECTITVPMLLICMLLLPMLFLCFVEIAQLGKSFRLRSYAHNLGRSLGLFSAGFIATYLSTELAKRVLGRLRPHFYAACQPRLVDGSSCDDTRNRFLYVEQYYCANHNLTVHQMRELYVSFPSAHASLSFYAMLFLGFYLHAVWRGGGTWRVLRHTAQFTLLSLAWFVSLSRVADYWHHWSDVLAGALMGVAHATVTALYVGQLTRPRGDQLRYKRAPQKPLQHVASSTGCLQQQSTVVAGVVAAGAGGVASAKEHLVAGDCEWKMQAVLPT